MSRRKKKFQPKAWESAGQVQYGKRLIEDTSASIFESMLQSDSFKALKARQRFLYILCKSQYYGKKKPRHEFPDNEELKSDDLFFLNWAAVKRYALYSDTDSSTFYKDMKVLTDRGFIEKVASGKPNHSKTIYKFSDKWKYTS